MNSRVNRIPPLKRTLFSVTGGGGWRQADMTTFPAHSGGAGK